MKYLALLLLLQHGEVTDSPSVALDVVTDSSSGGLNIARQGWEGAFAAISTPQSKKL